MLSFVMYMLWRLPRPTRSDPPSPNSDLFRSLEFCATLAMTKMGRSGGPVVRRNDPRRCQLGLMAFLAPLFGERLAFPFLHRRMREHMIDPSLSGAGVEAIGADAEGDGREEGVHGAEIGPREPWPAEAR